MFWCFNQRFLFANGSKCGLARRRARCRFSSSRHSWHSRERFVGSLKIKLGNRFELGDRPSVQPQLGRRKTDAIDNLVNEERCEEEPDFVVSAAESLLTLCSSFSITKVEVLDFIFPIRALTITRLESTFLVLRTVIRLQTAHRSKFYERSILIG